MQPLNIIKDYYGEKMAFFFAWLIHYTGFLIVGSILGLLCTALSFAYWIDNSGEKDIELLYDTPLVFVYGLCLVIWLTIFNESWKRSQNKIACMWHVRNFTDVTAECENFEGEAFLNPETSIKERTPLKSVLLRRYLQTFILVVISIGAVIGA